MTVVVISKSIEVANFKIEKDIALASIVALSWAFFFYLRWILGLANANKKDREIAKHYEKYLQRLSQSHFGYGLQISLKRGESGWILIQWSHGANILTTIIFTISAIVSIYRCSKFF
jgi:hypothetical protein